MACGRSQNVCDGGARKRTSGLIDRVDFVVVLLSIY